MLLAISYPVNPFAIEVGRDLDIEELLWMTNLAAIIGAISYGSTTIVGLRERFHLPTLSTSAERSVRAVASCPKAGPPIVRNETNPVAKILLIVHEYLVSCITAHAFN
jgi:hypothetical protein